MAGSFTALWAQTSGSTEEQVQSLYKSDRWAEVVKLSLGNQHPSATLLFYRGLALARLNQLSAAAAAFNQGLSAFPADKRFPLELAGIAYKQSEMGRAKQYLRAALRLDPKDTYGNDFLANLYLLDGNLAAALAHWNAIGKPVIQELRFEPQPILNSVLTQRTFTISGGQLFTLDRLSATEANLRRLHVLAEVRYDLIPRSRDERSDLIIRTVPLAPPLSGFLGQVLPMLRQLPYQGVAFDFYNMRRSGVNLSVLGRWDPDKRRINVELSGPWHQNPRNEYRYFADLRDETWILQPQYFAVSGNMRDVLLRTANAGVDFSIGLSSRLQWTVGGSVKYRDYGRTQSSSFLFARGWSAELDNRFDYRLWSWPERRVRTDGFAALKAGRFFAGTSTRLIGGRVGLRTEWFPGAKDDRYTVTQRIQAGRTFGNVALDEWFLLGMERDNDRDLWLRGITGTRDGRKGSAPMGREYAITQTDVMRKLFALPLVRLYAGPFFDAGTVGDPSHLAGSHGVLYDAGVQVAVRTVGSVTVTLIYGRDLVNGRGVFYTAVSR